MEKKACWVVVMGVLLAAAILFGALVSIYKERAEERRANAWMQKMKECSEMRATCEGNDE